MEPNGIFLFLNKEFMIVVALKDKSVIFYIFQRLYNLSLIFKVGWLIHLIFCRLAFVTF